MASRVNKHFFFQVSTMLLSNGTSVLRSLSELDADHWHHDHHVMLSGRYFSFNELTIKLI